jgi:hypothetical protein
VWKTSSDSVALAFVENQESGPTLLLVVRGERVTLDLERLRYRREPVAWLRRARGRLLLARKRCRGVGVLMATRGG